MRNVDSDKQIMISYLKFANMLTSPNIFAIIYKN